MKWLWYGIAASVIIVDQVTKQWAVAHLDFASPVPIVSWLNFTLLYNEGAAFSFLAGAGGWQRWFFAVVAVVVSVILVVWIAKLPRTAKCLGLALALILGGALGNLYDRVLLGHVVDFIDVYLLNCGSLVRFFPTCHWPAFNIADMAISAGAILLLIDSLFLGSASSQTDDHDQLPIK